MIISLYRSISESILKGFLSTGVVLSQDSRGGVRLYKWLEFYFRFEMYPMGRDNCFSCSAAGSEVGGKHSDQNLFD